MLKPKQHGKDLRSRCCVAEYPHVQCRGPLRQRLTDVAHPGGHQAMRSGEGRKKRGRAWGVTRHAPDDAESLALGVVAPEVQKVRSLLLPASVAQISLRLGRPAAPASTSPR